MTMPARPESNRRLWLSYGLLSLMAWLLYGMAGTDWQRGTRTLVEALYEATWSLGLGLALGPLAYPWTRWLQRRQAHLVARLAWHALAALVFVVLWQGLELLVAWALFGWPHAQASFEQGMVWRAAWGVIIYTALVLGFGGALLARQAQHEALRAARAEAALVRAELAVISGKLNPHFLFNTLNTLLLLTRRDPARAEAALLGFSRLMRYALDSTRHADSRVSLGDELAFVRDYLALEQLRLGERLRVMWEVEPQAEDEEIAPLTLQPLVENAVAHGIAPRPEGGTVHISARRSPAGLQLQVRDDGPGCTWPLSAPKPSGGVGLSALMRRFELDYEGRATLDIRTAPGQGFTVNILVP
jgi:signal transduction histidine kinase